MPYTSVDFNVWADVDGTIVELVQFDCSYEMNKIPTCTAVLPVGYRVVPPYTSSTAHDIADDVQVQVPITVYVQTTVMATAPTTPPAIVPPIIAPVGTYKLFCGWITGIGYCRTYQGYAMTITATHWLSALTFSSTLSATSHPHNPTDFTFNAAINADVDGAELKHYTPATLMQSAFLAGDLQDDLWGKVLHPFLTKLACTDRINKDAFGLDAINDGGDNEAKAALDLINIGTPPAVTLPMVAAGGGDEAAMAIANDLAVNILTPASVGNTAQSLAHTTFWDKIVGDICPRYYLKLIPYPERAVLAPFIAGLRDEWNPGGGAATIIARDMSHQDMESGIPRPLRAVGLFTSHGGQAGANMRPLDGVNNAEIGGMYIGTRPNGLVMLKEAPSYLSESVTPAVYAAKSSGIGSTRANAFNHPVAGDAPAVGDPAQPKVLKLAAQPVLLKMAQAMFVGEALKNRYGDIVGPVRFDISPGSSISFQGTEGSPVPADGEIRYGAVLRVKYSFDAQGQQCYTAYRLINVHTVDEHASDDYSIADHPLYTENFIGDVHTTLGADCPEMVGVCPVPEED